MRCIGILGSFSVCVLRRNTSSPGEHRCRRGHRQREEASPSIQQQTETTSRANGGQNHRSCCRSTCLIAVKASQSRAPRSRACAARSSSSTRSLPPTPREGRLLRYRTGLRAPGCFYTSYIVYLPTAGTPSYAHPPPQPRGAPSSRSSARASASGGASSRIFRLTIFSIHPGARLARAPTTMAHEGI